MERGISHPSVSLTALSPKNFRLHPLLTISIGSTLVYHHCLSPRTPTLSLISRLYSGLCTTDSSHFIPGHLCRMLIRGRQYPSVEDARALVSLLLSPPLHVISRVKSKCLSSGYKPACVAMSPAISDLTAHSSLLASEFLQHAKLFPASQALCLLLSPDLNVAAPSCHSDLIFNVTSLETAFPTMQLRYPLSFHSSLCFDS